MYRYLPDLPPNTPETWRVCDGFHPDVNGIYRTGFMATSHIDYGTGIYTTGKAYRTTAGGIGVLLCRVLDSPTNGALLVYNGSTWNDRMGSTDARIYSPEQIAQFGNITLIGNASDGVYSRDATGTSNFAAVSGSPDVNVLLVTPQNIVVGLHTILPGNATVTASDAWATSDVFDYTNWTTGEAASGNLRQTGGQLTAGVVLGNDVIAFKRRGVYRGQYVGGAVKWVWQLIDPELGAYGPGCAVTAANVVYFYGDNGFMAYDGSQFRKLDSGIGPTLRNAIADPAAGYSGSNHTAIRLVYDSLNRKICVFNFGYITGQQNGSKRPSFFSYGIDSGAWGYQSRVKDETDDSDDYYGVVAGGEEFNSFTNGVPTYNSNIALISETNTDIRMLSAEFASSNCGTNYKPKLRTYREGARNSMTAINRFIPGWTTSEGAGTDLSGATVKTGTPYYSDAVIETETAGTAQTLSTDQYQVDFTRSARFQSVEIQINCEACIDGGEFEGQKAGRK